jgi:hypothetical protein
MYSPKQKRENRDLTPGGILLSPAEDSGGGARNRNLAELRLFLTLGALAPRLE